MMIRYTDPKNFTLLHSDRGMHRFHLKISCRPPFILGGISAQNLVKLTNKTFLSFLNPFKSLLCKYTYEEIFNVSQISNLES